MTRAELTYYISMTNLAETMHALIILSIVMGIIAFILIFILFVAFVIFLDQIIYDIMRNVPTIYY